MEAVTYHSQTGYRVALVGEGRKWLHAIMLDVPLRVEKLDKRERRLMNPLPGNGATTKRYALHLIRWGRRWGMTKAARRMLGEARR